MLTKLKLSGSHFFRIQICFIVTIILVRLFEFISLSAKFFSVKHPVLYSLSGVFYDTWSCLIYGFALFIPFFLIWLLHKRTAGIVLTIFNISTLIFYISLIIVFSERTRPFDHEFFTRETSESLLTIKQFATSGFTVFLPFIIYISFYFILNKILKNKFTLKPVFLYILTGLTIISVVFIKFAMPNEKWFKKSSDYYFVCNKMTYWAEDSYQYFKNKDGYSIGGLDKNEYKKQLAYYWKNHPFEYTNEEYPLLHKNTSPDVLSNFLNLSKEKPNIVILVIEGLSRDFSCDSAEYGSFTPYIDSLSHQSLYWENHISTAPGTFAAHPALEGSLPYGSRGFSRTSIMPNHLSLIKILRRNGYFTYFMTGSGLDFDNLGGFMRAQSTDFILQKYSSKYKEMGVGPGGWSMGYPDESLFSRSFEVLDSLKKTPYLSIFHTATSHEPYLFVEKPVYEKLFDKKFPLMKISKEARKTMKACKGVITTFMYADDCVRKFFNEYKKRADYKNTIFFITGDHHIGSIPSIGEIDDYHVPFMIFSPMLKKPHKFYSVNSHNNLTPTILGMLNKNYKMDFIPPEVHWMDDVMDTCRTFRNTHSMAFMSWSRDIPDYLYKNYYIYEERLYKLLPGLKEEELNNDSIKKVLTDLRDNFRYINWYVCMKNKVYPQESNLLPGEKELLLEFKNLKEEAMKTKEDRLELMKRYRVPREYHYLYVDVSLEFYTASKDSDNYPAIQLALVDTTRGNNDYQYSSNKDVTTLTEGTFTSKIWNKIATSDIFNLYEYPNAKNLVFDLAVYSNINKIDVKKRNLEVKIYGIK